MENNTQKERKRARLSTTTNRNTEIHIIPAKEKPIKLPRKSIRTIPRQINPPTQTAIFGK